MDSKPWVIDDDRYDRLRLIAWWDQERLAASKILVVGAGALGNEVLKNLALLGVGQIFVVDFDHIEETNLTRSVLFRRRDCGKSKAETAALALADLNPDCRVIGWDADVMLDIGLGVFRDVDLVIGCLDNREARLWVNRCCWRTGVPWIDGGIQEINGVVKVFVPPHSACYECAMTENDYRLINLRYSCPLLRHEDVMAGRVPTAPTISSIIAGMQTQEALKLLHHLPVQAGAITVFNGATNRLYTTAIQRKEDCLSHEPQVEPTLAPLRAENHRVADVLTWARGQFGGESWSLELDRDLIVSMNCGQCESREEVLRPASRLALRQATCGRCGQMRVLERVHRIDSLDALAEMTLRKVGIPPFDIIRLRQSDRTFSVLLEADRGSVLKEGLLSRGQS